MGRPERPVDPTAGPVEAFAHALRDLRRAAGNPSYRTLAARANYSHTVLSDATRGERLPTLPVTLAFVRACGGDPAEWEARWHLHRQLAEGRLAPSTDDAPERTEPGPPAPDPGSGEGMDATAPGHGPPPAPAAPRRNVRDVLVRHTPVAVVAAVVAGACGWWLRPVPAPKAAPAAASASAAALKVDDGTDPKIAGCTSDAFPRANVPVRLDREARLHGRVLPAGTQVGTVYLNYSARCAGAWTRFVPTPGLNPVPTETSAARVSVQVDRPIDGTSSSWQMGHVDSMYSNLLLVGVGCVSGTAIVRMTGQDAVGKATTQCLGPP
ncbi:helix-turn-helix domain-containing protein [Actinomadura verrucosospora]|uniref:helix-turn-helix domain-containing protein n=1 Tax=Actinomadura verrucosospora TaxID=46165 RepID=UPI0015668CB7|nr:helix-turn-helix transcriptional regulator [Actinomadura verrucosospora]